MPASYSDQIEQAMQRLREQQERMAETAAKLQAATASATSKDRMVTVRVGAQGQVVSLTFGTDAYRTMAPAEVAAALVDVLNRAQADIGAQVAREMEAFTGLGDSLRASMVGGTELDTLLAPLYATRPAQPGRPVRVGVREEEFDGE